MRRLAVALAIVAASCSGGGQPPTEELVELATVGDTLAYTVVYGFTLSGPLAEAVSTAMEIRQLPPTSYRRFATTTKDADGNEVTNTQWFIQRSDGDFVCFAGGDDEATCQASTAPPAGMFGYAPVDAVFSSARAAGGFASVERTDDREVAGEAATCFRTESHRIEATPRGTPEPRFEVEGARYEICYTADGILVYARQEVVVDEGGGLPDERRSSVLEARTISRNVVGSDVSLPGPLADA